MKVTITPTPLSGIIPCISSKSLSHRYVIAAGLSKGKCHINHILASADLDATIQALRSFGVRVNKAEIDGDFEVKEATIDANESGSTLRFLIPISMIGNQKIKFIGHGKLPSRPLTVYETLFKHKGYHYKKLGDQELPLEVKGPLKGGHYLLPGDVSSQFLTGLLFALPLLKKDSVIELSTPLESRGYVDLTLDVLRKFGIHILKVDRYYYIKGGQQYKAIDADVEGDYSQAAFFLVAATIGESIGLTNLNPYSKQGDMRIIDIINQMGGYVHQKDDVLVTKPNPTLAMTIDLSQIPDLGPILMVLASLSQGTTKFINATRLRIKESDRLEAMRQTLTAFGVKVEVTAEDIVYITGEKKLKGNLVLDSFKDHRIAMAIAIASIRASGPVTILNAEAVDKSFPNFFEMYQQLGGKIDVTD